MFKIVFKRFVRSYLKLLGITVQVLAKNPADIASHDLSGKELVENSLSLWWNGPDFLKNADSNWPKLPPVKVDNEEAMTELAKCPPNVTHFLLNTQECSNLVNLPAVIDPKNYSSLTSLRLLRISAYVLQFIKKLKSNKSDNTGKPTRELSASEITEAETYWIKSVQTSDFAAEINFLMKNSQLLPLPRIKQFGLYMDD